MNALLQKLEQSVPKAALEHRKFGRSPHYSLWVEARLIERAARFLRDAPELSFDWLENAAMMQLGEALAITYFLRSRSGGRHLALRASVALPAAGDSGPVRVELTSLAGVWPSARAYESEIGELFGVNFSGESAVKAGSGLLPQGLEGFPLRKDFVFPPGRGVPA